MIKTVFFDLGNTILDYHSGNLTDEEKDIIGLWRMHGKVKEYGIEVQFEELMNTFYYPWVSSLSKRDESGKEFDIVSFLPEKIKENSGLFMELILEFHEPTARFARPIEGIREVLCEIKSRGMITGIILYLGISSIKHRPAKATCDKKIRVVHEKNPLTDLEPSD